MKIIRTYKFKLYQSKKNKHLHAQINIAGQIWNHALALQRRYFKLNGKNLNLYVLMKHITKLKKLPKYAHWNKLGSQAIQDVVQRLDRAYKLFFRNLKAGVKTAPPKFKKVKQYTSFTLKQAGYQVLEGNKIRIQGVVYKFCKSRGIPSPIKTLTVKRDNLGNLYLYFVTEAEISLANRTGNSAVGFDFGLKTFLVASDGSQIESPMYYRQAFDELRSAQRKLSSKDKFSNNWHKAKAKVARLFQDVVNRRRDWFFKLAHELTDRFDFLFFEELSMRGMQSLWGRKIGDLARSEFMDILQYIASTKDKVVSFVDRFYPSSKHCSTCGHLNQALKLSEREWACVGCGATHNRDVNAALNILREGASSLGVGDRRPDLSGNRRLIPESHVL